MRGGTKKNIGAPLRQHACSEETLTSTNRLYLIMVESYGGHTVFPESHTKAAHTWQRFGKGGSWEICGAG